jgi:(S)-sulfolactate dehydrogenase
VRSDVVTIHCPLNPETRGLISAAEMASMKKGAILINSARGGIVDEPACAAALKSAHLGGAALDVFDYEPIQAEAGKGFAGIPNVILTPHVSGVTLEATHRVSFMTVDSVDRVLKKSR